MRTDRTCPIPTITRRHGACSLTCTGRWTTSQGITPHHHLPATHNPIAEDGEFAVDAAVLPHPGGLGPRASLYGPGGTEVANSASSRPQPRSARPVNNRKG